MCYSRPKPPENFERSKPETETTFINTANHHMLYGGQTDNINYSWSESKSQNFRSKREEPFHQFETNKPYKCDKCLRTFDYRHSLIRHKKYDHTKSKSKEEPTENITEEVIVNNTQLNAIYMNVNSLIAKTRKYRVSKAIIESGADIVFLAETKLHKNSPEFKVQGYYEAKSLVRHANAGGLIVMAKNTIKLHSIIAKNVLPEIQVIQCQFNGQTIFAVYRSPSRKYMSVPEKEHHKTLVDYLTMKIKNLKGKPYTLVGDFNLGDLAADDFEDKSKERNVDDETIGVKSYVNKLWSDFFHNHFLQQWVCEPTYPRKGSILDILMTPVGQFVDVTVRSDLFQGSFDHYALDFKIKMSYDTNETPRTRRVKTRANWLRYVDLISNVQLHTHLQYCQNSEEMAYYIANNMKAAYDEAIPVVKVKLPKSCYLQKDTKRLSTRVSKLRKIKKKYAPGSQDYIALKNKIKRMDKDVDKMMKRDRLYHQKKKLDKAKDQKKSFYQHFKEAKSKPSVNITGPVNDLEGTLRTTDQEVANAFGQLMGVQLKPGVHPPNIDWFAEYAEEIYGEDFVQTKQFYVSPEMVKRQIVQCKISASHGPDGLPMEAFHVAKDVLAQPLAILFNLINQKAEIPSLFKIARVKMLFKKGEKSDMQNYRPLAMTSHMGKIWERVINKHLMDHLENTRRLSDRQYGFRRTRGTVENLIKLNEHVIDKLEAEKCQIEIWSFDLKKAFDRVDHPKVLKLLWESGVWGNLGKCIEHWLVDRLQYVEVENCQSETTNVGKSVIQGSCLGPSLWLLYIQSLTTKLERLGVEFFAYADDITIVKRLKTEQDKLEMENILNVLQEWADHFDMEWSPLKTQRLIVGYHKCRTHIPFKMFFGGKEILPLETTCTSLGILLGKASNFEEQRTKIYNTIKKLKGMITNSLDGISMFQMELYYQTFVMPHLIYCCQLWCGGEEKQLEKIERALDSFWKLGPTGRPPESVVPVRLLFIIFDLNYTKKMRDGLSPLNFEEIFKIPASFKGDYNKKLPVPHYKLTSISKTKFSTRARKYWNFLPKEIKDLSYPNFKKEAKLYVLSNADWFLNFGNKNGAGAKDLPKLKLYVPKIPKKVNGKANEEALPKEKVIIKRRYQKK